MTRIVFTISFMLVILATGCGGPKYVPDITLTQTGPIIDAIAEFHNLYPATLCCRERKPLASTRPRRNGSNPVSSPAKSRANSSKNSMRQGYFHVSPDLTHIPM